jgi:hypothetical protein
VSKLTHSIVPGRSIVELLLSMLMLLSSKSAILISGPILGEKVSRLAVREISA